MFETLDRAEIFVPKELSPDGERLWSYVQINAHRPWFYVEYVVDYGDLKSRSVLLLSSIEQLSDISNNTEFEIIQAHIVTPGHINKSDDWQMDRLKKVLRARRFRKNQEDIFTTYVSCDGREFSQNSGSEKPKPKSYETIFSLEI